MASRRFDVGQGALAWLVAGSLVIASACSSDSNVDFDPTTPGGGDSSVGGTKTSGSGSGSGAAQSGGSSNGNAGESDGGTGNNAGSGTSAGKNSGGQAEAGGANGGTNGGGGKAGSSNGGSASGGTNGSGGKAGSANGGSVNGGSAGTSSVAGSGGNAGTAGNGGSAGAGGGGNSDCVAATFGGHAYSFCGPVDSAAAAYTKCQSLGMKMVEIETLGEHNFVIGKQKGQSWLGGTDELKEGEWRWASTTQVFWDGAPRGDFGSNDGRVDGVYSNFIVGQPNDTNVDGFHENCLAINANGWNDLYCNLGNVRAACEAAGPVVQPNQ